MSDCWGRDDRAHVLAEVSDSLWRFVGRHAYDVYAATRVVADLTGLPQGNLDLLRHLHLVLSDEVALAVASVPALAARLRPVAPVQVHAGRGAVRGRIDWGATMATRARTGGDGALHVALAARTRWDTPEARLLYHLLRALDASCSLLRQRIGIASPGPGADVTDDGTPEPTTINGYPRLATSSTLPRGVVDAQERGARTPFALGDPTTLSARLAHIQAAVQSALADPRLAALTASPAAVAPVADADVAACRRATRPEVRALAAAWTLYDRLVARPAVSALLDALRVRALAPLDDDLLYEVWALLGAASALDDGGWRLERAALVGQGAVPFAYHSHNGRTVARLYFGHTPLPWREGSRYRAVFERYGLSAATRRPDLIIEVARVARRGMLAHGDQAERESGPAPSYLLVEVKRTCDPGYIAESIYKVLGYLADFEDAYAAQEGARALLLLWDGLGDTGALAHSPHSDALILATHTDYRATLASILAALAPQMLSG